MKIEQLMVQYLYKYKTVNLQDMGTFTISPEIDILQDSDKETILPDGAISFQYNSKALQDEGLVDFIVQQSRKIRPLASSDLESYSILSRQFLNIGKPMIIEGLGTLQKNQQGTFDFLQGHTVSSKMEAAPVAMKEKQQDEISFSTKAKEPDSKKGLLIAVAVVLLLSAAAAVYYFMMKDNKDVPVTENSIPVTEKDTLKSTDNLLLPVTDSNTSGPNTATASPATNDGFSFKVVLKEYPTKIAADKAFEKLRSYGHKLLISSKDSVTYKISMPFTSPLSDTLRARDSLKIFFGGKPYIEL